MHSTHMTHAALPLLSYYLVACKGKIVLDHCKKMKRKQTTTNNPFCFAFPACLNEASTVLLILVSSLIN